MINMMSNEHSVLRPLRICIYVQHLLGTGHLVRMMTLAETLSDFGHKVTLLSGGFYDKPNSVNYRFHSLPSLRAAADRFDVLLDENGNAVDERFKTRRMGELLGIVEDSQPDVVLIETFPFGRRQMEFELVPLLELTKSMDPKPMVLSSIRDILQKRKAKRYPETLTKLQRWFDGVVVHGDPCLIPLSASFPLANEIPNLYYSGYLTHGGARDQNVEQQVGQGEVIVSAGGGAVGMDLLSNAIRAKSLSSLSDRLWRILVGQNAAKEAQSVLSRIGVDNVVVEPNRPDFFNLLKGCQLSISQAGYNTCMDIIAANTRAVLVPFGHHGETEQLQRAKVFHEKGLAWMVEEATLTPHALADAIEQAMAMPPPPSLNINREGAVNTAKIICDLCSKH